MSEIEQKIINLCNRLKVLDSKLTKIENSLSVDIKNEHVESINSSIKLLLIICVVILLELIFFLI